MASWSDNIEAVARAVTAKRLAHDGISEEQLAVDVDMWWHLTAAELECRVIDETGEYVGGEIDWKRKMEGYRDWMRRHPGRPHGSGRLYRGAEAFRGLGGSPDREAGIQPRSDRCHSEG